MTRTFADPTRMMPWLAAAALMLTGDPRTTAAQTAVPAARNAIYFELGGNAILYSVNYERRLADLWTVRAGFMMASLEGTDPLSGQRAEADLAIVPVMMNALLGRGTHRFELGAGPLFGIGSGELEDAEIGETENFRAAGLAGVTGTIGYRRQPPNGGFVFRAGLVPFYSGDAQLWAGLSAGWSF